MRILGSMEDELPEEYEIFRDEEMPWKAKYDEMRHKDSSGSLVTTGGDDWMLGKILI